MSAALLSACKEEEPVYRDTWQSDLHRFVCKCEDQSVLATTEDYGSARFVDSRLSDLFNALNVEYFEGSLPALPVRVGIPWFVDDDEWHGASGLTRLIPHSGDVRHGADLRIYLADFLFAYHFDDEASRWDLVADTLFNEMIHAAVYLGLPYFSACIRTGESPKVSDAESEDYARADWPKGGNFTPLFEALLRPSVIENFAYPRGRP